MLTFKGLSNQYTFSERIGIRRIVKYIGLINDLWEVTHKFVKLFSQSAEAYLEPRQKSTMELNC